MASIANQNNKTSFSHADSNVAAEEDIHVSVKVSDDDTLAVPNQNNFAGTIITD